MKVWQLRAEQVASLLAQPESGMGFQIIETGRAYSRDEEGWIVFNAELALAFDSPIEARQWIDGSRGAATDGALRAAAVDPGTLYRDLRVAVTRVGVGIRAATYGAASSITPSAMPLVKQTITVAGTRYFRFSAFQNDRRVDPITGRFLPGTYATTDTDRPMAPSGFAAVGRYALPNVVPSSFVHALSASSGAVIHVGTVAPAYGQSGGGVEVFFPHGVNNASPRTPPQRLPDE
jgi:hypothetical protein